MSFAESASVAPSAAMVLPLATSSLSVRFITGSEQLKGDDQLNGDLPHFPRMASSGAVYLANLVNPRPAASVVLVGNGAGIPNLR